MVCLGTKSSKVSCDILVFEGVTDSKSFKGAKFIQNDYSHTIRPQ